MEYLGSAFLYLDCALAVFVKSQSVAYIGAIRDLNLNLLDIVEV